MEAIDIEPELQLYRALVWSLRLHRLRKPACAPTALRDPFDVFAATLLPREPSGQTERSRLLLKRRIAARGWRFARAERRVVGEC